MSDSDKVDVIVFGATGYTGKYVVQEFISICENKYTWAIAGRSSKKLQDVLEWASAKTGTDVRNIPIIICDCDDQASINKMTRRGRVVINCCGPYRLYGEPIVKACIENGTHHVDVSGEPDYMEIIQMEYHEAAEKKGVYIISACGFDSVPCDIGIIHFINNFPGQVNSIESYLKFSFPSKGPMLNTGTWKTAVQHVTNEQNVIEIRKKLYASLKEPKLEPRLKSRCPIHLCELFNNGYSLPFLGSDGPVVYRTQIFLRDYYKQRPVQYNPYFICPSIIALIGLLIIGLFLKIFTMFSFGRQLLLQYPEFFTLGIMSSKGPSKENLANSSACFRFKIEGWSNDVVDKYENKEVISEPPNKKMFTELSIKNPAYGFTSTSVILSALTILEEYDKMPSKGGVYTPGGAFYKTSFFDRLLKNGVSVKIFET